jgi:hypothetical protein
MDEEQGLELTEGNIETVLDEIRPYLVGELPWALTPLVCCGFNYWQCDIGGLPSGAPCMQSSHS